MGNLQRLARLSKADDKEEDDDEQIAEVVVQILVKIATALAEKTNRKQPSSNRLPLATIASDERNKNFSTISSLSFANNRNCSSRSNTIVDMDGINLSSLVAAATFSSSNISITSTAAVVTSNAASAATAATSTFAAVTSIVPKNDSTVTSGDSNSTSIFYSDDHHRDYYWLSANSFLLRNALSNLSETANITFIQNAVASTEYYDNDYYRRHHHRRNSTIRLPTNKSSSGSHGCGKWVTAQHNIFQFSNICFLSGFAIPRNYKASMLLFRLMLTVSFLVTAVWAGVYSCAFDTFLWGSLLAMINGVHTVVLLYKFLPPALSLELTELYIRLFKPLKVSRKNFKELTKEAIVMKLSAGETYAKEEITSADEKLSILLRGRMKVSCDGTFMHNISCYQFIDSPEWQGNNTACGIRFQVTITAEEDCVYLCWSRLKLDRVLRHRPQLKFVLNNIIGKDITHKMYSLNEQVGHICASEALSRSAREDHWRRSMNRSVSVDAVDTGTKGHVRSIVWKQSEKQKRKDSTYSESESPLLGQQQCWLPVVASQFPAENPFLRQDTETQDDIKNSCFSSILLQKPQQDHFQLMTPATKIETSIVQQLPIFNVSTNNTLLPSQPVALLPVIVPVLTAPVTTPLPGRLNLKQTRGVKFDETCL